MSKDDDQPVVPALDPVYGWANAGESVELWSGQGRIQGQAGEVRFWLPLVHDSHPLWESIEPLRLWLGDHHVSFDHPVYGSVSLPVSVNSDVGDGGVLEVDLGVQVPLAKVLVHWINVPGMLPESIIETSERRWAGRVEFVAGPWLLTLDARADLAEQRRSARRTGAQFLMSHVGAVRRSDGATFSPADAQAVIVRWQVAMSFAFGRWVAPALPVGFDHQGGRVWEEWGRWRCDWLRGYESWWDDHRLEDLSAVVKTFVEMEADEYKAVRHAAVHAIAANHAGTTTEAKVMLAQAGLEFLAWSAFVLTGLTTATKFEKLTASERIRDLLGAANISTDVPDDLEAVAMKAGILRNDAPAVVTWLRNRLIHPKDVDEPYEVQQLLWQASQLAVEYLELSILHRIGFEGMYTRRYPPGRQAHRREPVPWSQQTDAAV